MEIPKFGDSVVLRRDKLNEELQELQRGAKTSAKFLAVEPAELAKHDEQYAYILHRKSMDPTVSDTSPFCPWNHFFLSLSHLRNAEKRILLQFFLFCPTV